MGTTWAQPPPRSAALDAEHGAKRRLAQGNNHVFADLAHAVGQTDRRGGFAFACGRGIDGGHQDKLAGLMRLHRAASCNLPLALYGAVHLKILFGDAGTVRNGGNMLGGYGLGNFNV